MTIGVGWGGRGQTAQGVRGEVHMRGLGLEGLIAAREVNAEE